MTEQLGRLTLEQRNDGFVLAGAIDETSQLDVVLAKAKAGTLVLDLAGITFINSLGVRDWIRMLSAATKANIKVELRRVSEPIVHQLNMIVATRGTATVASFYAPYACDSCGREDSLLIDAIRNQVQLERLQAPPMACPECKSNMAFNDFPERYFSFLART